MNVTVLERLSVFTPLGVRFWDPVTRSSPVDGLDVSLASDLGERLGRPRAAFRTGGGVFAFRNLPGLDGIEQPGTEPVASPPVTRPFVLQVVDRQRRFVPLALRLTLPLPYSGLYPRDPGEAPGEGGNRRFLLMSAPARSVPLWQGHIAGRLANRAGDPAAHAAIAASFPTGETFVGIADADGAFAIALPFPEVLPGPPTSPPQSNAISAQEWPFTLRVHHAPGGLVPIPGTDLPDYTDILGQLEGPASPIYPTLPAADGTDVPDLAGVLRRDSTFAVRTAGADALLIDPVPTSP